MTLSQWKSNSKNKYFVYKDGVIINHRTPLKLIVNPILRFFQFYTEKPYVIVSFIEFDSYGNGNFIRYGFKRVKKFKKSLDTRK